VTANYVFDGAPPYSSALYYTIAADVHIALWKAYYTAYRHITHLIDCTIRLCAVFKVLRTFYAASVGIVGLRAGKDGSRLYSTPYRRFWRLSAAPGTWCSAQSAPGCTPSSTSHDTVLLSCTQLFDRLIRPEEKQRGMVRRSAFVVLRLITSVHVVSSSTSRPLDLAPLSILSTKVAITYRSKAGDAGQLPIIVPAALVVPRRRSARIRACLALVLSGAYWLHRDRRLTSTEQAARE
jgi:hypothetical protein